MNNMNKMKIRLNATADVQEFVRAAEKCDFDIDIQYDSTIVDAKSILGIFSLGRCLANAGGFGGFDFNGAD